MENAALVAFDIGATSGRAVLARLESGHGGPENLRIAIEEIHRFRNEPATSNGEMRWDMAVVWRHIQFALARAASHGAGRLRSIGVDTWGVDYALLDDQGRLLENPYHYRDPRTEGMMERAVERLGRERIYDITGIQFMPINTLYQLYAAAERSPESLRAARSLLMIPDLLNFWLAGTISCEYTNATTTQFLDRRTGAWSCELLEALGIPSRILAPVIQPGTVIGPVLPRAAPGSALDGVVVVAPACHDTGSAVAAVRASAKTAFLSSGTWSLLGAELESPVVTPEALRLNFTNEGGVCGTVRLLKNITGMWLLEGCCRAWQKSGTWTDDPGDWDALLAASAAEYPFRHLVDPDDPLFVRPADMTSAIDEYCRRTDQPSPDRPAAYARAVLESLALKYRLVLEQLEMLTAARYETIRIIGGGSQNMLLNGFTANATGRLVLAGPVEATALGNIAMQLVGTGLVPSLPDAMLLIERSFPPRPITPKQNENWDGAYARFRSYCESR